MLSSHGSSSVLIVTVTVAHSVTTDISGISVGVSVQDVEVSVAYAELVSIYVAPGA